MTKMRESAINGWQLLNGIVGDLIVPCRTREMYQVLRNDNQIREATFSIANRMCLSQLFITLSKCTEFYGRYQQHVIPEECRPVWKTLRDEIKRRGIIEFRNKYVAHIWCKKRNRSLNNMEVDSMVKMIVQGDPEAFVRWCNESQNNIYPATICSIAQHTRNRIMENFALTDDEVGANTNPEK